MLSNTIIIDQIKHVHVNPRLAYFKIPANFAHLTNTPKYETFFHPSDFLSEF